MSLAPPSVMFSQILGVPTRKQPASSDDSSAARLRRQRYFPGQQTPQSAKRLTLQAAALPYVPSSIRCPEELSPIDCHLGQSVPFADILQNVRNRCLPTAELGRRFEADQDEFEWLDQVNNSSGESSSRKVAAKESAKRDIDNYFFMYFRIRMENYVALVTALKQSSKDESIFNEESIDKWTHKYKFKIRRAAPLKKVLMAFSSRMGLEGDPDVMYCADGFYGDSFTGRTYNKNEVPNNRILPANTSLATGLRNGSNIYVSRITNAEKNNAIAQLQMDLSRGNEPSDEEGDEGQSSSASGSPGQAGANKDNQQSDDGK
ncbi:hypothetical protein BOX15_Mlig015806g2 [Macrostomum lignano]|uniref:Uncharacterized protein n=1 Tax=Macrostomum lignano TaxID=282301 RepID=A0A267FY24_9PLAT|nr:hypothetical protein BOX15_Mlig015806g2 [Macrostomum lignano]